MKRYRKTLDNVAVTSVCIFVVKSTLTSKGHNFSRQQSSHAQKTIAKIEICLSTHSSPNRKRRVQREKRCSYCPFHIIGHALVDAILGIYLLSHMKKGHLLKPIFPAGGRLRQCTYFHQFGGPSWFVFTMPT